MVLCSLNYIWLVKAISHSIDSNWTSNVDNQKFFGSYAIFLGDSLISWSYSKQHIISYPLTKAEYKAIANGFVRLKWIKYLFHEARIF